MNTIETKEENNSKKSIDIVWNFLKEYFEEEGENNDSINFGKGDVKKPTSLIKFSKIIWKYKSEILNKIKI